MKKKNIIITSIILILILLITTITLLSLFFTGYWNKVTWIEQKTYSDGLYEDAKQKADEDNVSVFLLERKGAYIFSQTILDILIQEKLNPDKEIYVGFTEDTSPDTSPGFPKDLDWSFAHLDGTFMLENSYNVTSKDIDNLYDILPSDEKDKHIDLYSDSLSYCSGQNTSIIKDLGNSIQKIDSFTFFTDGTHVFALQDQKYKEYKKMGNTDFTKESKILTDIHNGKDISNYSNKELKRTSRALLSLRPNDSDDTIRAFGLSSDLYNNDEFSGRRDNILQLDGAGIKKAKDIIGKNDDLIGFFELQDYIDNYIPKQIGKQNILFSGTVVTEGSKKEIDKEASTLKLLYDKYNPIENDINILYKSHPRSTDEGIEEVISKVSELTGTDAHSWIINVPNRIPFEAFAITGLLEDDPETNTDYQLYLFGTSTVVPALYEAGIDSDNIEMYIATSKDKKFMHSWYDNTPIIDWTKLN